MTQVLNPYLYERLVNYYGDVEIVNAGAAIEWSLADTPIFGTSEFRKTRKRDRSGEEYRVRCKKCRDHRARLYISYMWGVPDDETGSRNLWLLNCYNEACYQDYQDQYWLYETIYEASFLSNPQSRLEILPGKIGGSLVLRPMEWPGPTIQLDELAKRAPNHPALTYLHDRGFDPERLGRLYGVGYCTQSHYRWATDRIVIPIYQSDMLVGWQTRYIGDDVNGVSFNEAKVPKYWTCPGMARRLVAYNLERALVHPTVVVVEGTTDVWNTGPNGLGALGKTLSTEIREQVINAASRHGDDFALVIALDPKQDEKAKARGDMHHTDRLYTQLCDLLNRRVLKFEWPDLEMDPGSIDRDWFRDLIRQQADAIGLKVSFTKPKIRS